jgi:hypothetical protein
MGKESVVWSFEYGNDSIANSVRAALTDSGIGIDMYLEFFGFPDKYKEMEIDPAWFTPPLPGMDQHTDYVATMAGAEDLLDRKKQEAFEKDLSEENRWDGYNISLDDDEADMYMQDESTQYMFEDHSQFMYDDMLADIEYLLDGHDDWCVEGSNMNWRGVSGHTFITDATPKKLIGIFSSYGDYSLKCTQTEEEKEKGTFTIVCYHHDCPMGSSFEFIKQTGEINET